MAHKLSRLAAFTSPLRGECSPSRMANDLDRLADADYSMGTMPLPNVSANGQQRCGRVASDCPLGSGQDTAGRQPDSEGAEPDMGRSDRCSRQSSPSARGTPDRMARGSGLVPAPPVLSQCVGIDLYRHLDATQHDLRQTTSNPYRTGRCTSRAGIVVNTDTILRPREDPKIGSRVDPDISGVPGMRSFRILTWTEYITLASLAAQPYWVGWQVEDRPNGGVTKMPYAPGGGKARADDPGTWGSRPAAEQRATLLPRPYGIGGVGLELANLGDGRSVGGLALVF